MGKIKMSKNGGGWKSKLWIFTANGFAVLSALCEPPTVSYKGHNCTD